MSSCYLQSVAIRVGIEAAAIRVKVKVKNTNSYELGYVKNNAAQLLLLR